MRGIDPKTWTLVSPLLDRALDLPSEERRSLLASVRAPTQILHGLQDPLVPVEAGRELARRIDGARIDLIEGMGHDLPPPLWPRFAEGIVAVAGRA